MKKKSSKNKNKLPGKWDCSDSRTRMFFPDYVKMRADIIWAEMPTEKERIEQLALMSEISISELEQFLGYGGGFKLTYDQFMKVCCTVGYQWPQVEDKIVRPHRGTTLWR